MEVYAEPNGEVRVDGSCSCPVATNCKHVAALLLAWQNRWGATAMPAGARTAGELTQTGDTPLESTSLAGPWREIISAFQADATGDALPTDVRQRLVYVLFRQDRPRGLRLVVQMRTVSVLKNGHWGKSEKPYAAGNALRGQTAKFVTVQDAEILQTLATNAAREASPCSWTSGLYGEGPYPLDGPAARWLSRACAPPGGCTGRTFIPALR